jgi:arylsulfatase A-like enzyme
VVLDTVRYDRFERRNGQPHLPHLERLAARGVRFDNAWSTSSWSLPSQASILTGRYPHEHGADWPDFRLAEGCPTLGEALTRRGYATGAFSGNAAWITPEYLGRGFLRFDVYRPEDLLRRTVVGRMADHFLCEVGYHSAGRGRKADRVNNRFLRFLDDYPDRPFFAYLCYMDVNQGFHACRYNAYFGRLAPTPEVVQAYDQSLQELDDQLGALLAELEQRGILENTVLIVTSDHGESFGADQTTDHDPPGHGTSLYLEQTKVPLLVVYPAWVPVGRKVTRTVSIRAIPATIAHLLGLPDSPFDGPPLLSPDGHEDVQRPGARGDAALATLKYGGRDIQSLIWDGWHYIADPKSEPSKEELYDTKSDLLERNNLAPRHPVLAPVQVRLQRLLSGRSELFPERPSGAGTASDALRP